MDKLTCELNGGKDPEREASGRPDDSIVELSERIGGDAASDLPAETRDLISSIRTCVDNMPPQRRKVFLMSRRESLSNKEIAQKLSLSEKTVERHITLALTDLKKNHLS